EMKKEDKQAATPAVDSELAAQLKQAQESLASQQADFQAMQELMEELSTKLQKAEAALQDNQAAKEALIAEAKAKTLAARKEKVMAAIGENEKADKLLVATEGMDDEAFTAVVSALAGSVEKEAQSEMFKEVGVAAQADAAKVVEKSAVMKALQEKYSKD
ncbi:MAG: hypothetical protein KGI54_17000, partial [Pseudomonadota bacterium]|nr:hypothetical protein [Pseudomonadota bacterium]